MEEITPQEGWLNTSALRMHYLDWNSPTASHGQDHKPVVVALHGLASSCHWYDLVIPRLVDNYRCISLDQRGHGQTDQPPSGYDWHTLSTDVVEAFYQLGVQKAAVMGHSWGGYVALSLAAKYPASPSWLWWMAGLWTGHAGLVRPGNGLLTCSSQGTCPERGKNSSTDYANSWQSVGATISKRS